MITFKQHPDLLRQIIQKVQFPPSLGQRVTLAPPLIDERSVGNLDMWLSAYRLTSVHPDFIFVSNAIISPFLFGGGGGTFLFLPSLKFD